MRTSTHKYWIFAIVFAIVLGLSSPQAKAQQFAVKTNALMWGVLTPNAGVEIVVGERSSLDISAFYKPSYSPELGSFFNSRIAGFQPEYRYWFNGRPMTREFIGASLMFADYDLTNADKSTGMRYVYDGNAISLGIVGGYSFILGRNNDKAKDKDQSKGKARPKVNRWRLELCGGFSFLGFLQKRYNINDSYDDYFVGEPVKANSWGYKLFPAKLGVTFTYIIK
jgi:hypothetical protein